MLLYRFPILLDATASEMQVCLVCLLACGWIEEDECWQRKGDAMMAKWAEVMTGLQPKTYFLQPHIGIPMAFSIVREAFEQRVLGKPDRYYAQ